MNKFIGVLFEGHVVQSRAACSLVGQDFALVCANPCQNNGFPKFSASDVEEFATRAPKGELGKKWAKDYSKMSAQTFWKCFSAYFKEKCGEYRYNSALDGIDVSSYKAVKVPVSGTCEFMSSDEAYKIPQMIYYVDITDKKIYDAAAKDVTAENVFEIHVSGDQYSVPKAQVIQGSALQSMIPDRFWIKNEFRHLFVKPPVSFTGIFDPTVYPVKSPISEFFFVASIEKYAPNSFRDGRYFFSGTTTEALFCFRALHYLGYEIFDRDGNELNLQELTPALLNGSIELPVQQASFGGERLSSLVTKHARLSTALSLAVATAVIALTYLISQTKIGAAALDRVFDVLPAGLQVYFRPLLSVNPHRWREVEVQSIYGSRIEAKDLVTEHCSVFFPDIGLALRLAQLRFRDASGLVVRIPDGTEYYVVDFDDSGDAIVTVNTRKVDGSRVSLQLRRDFIAFG